MRFYRCHVVGPPHPHSNAAPSVYRRFSDAFQPHKLDGALFRSDRDSGFVVEVLHANVPLTGQYTARVVDPGKTVLVQGDFIEHFPGTGGSFSEVDPPA